MKEYLEIAAIVAALVCGASMAKSFHGQVREAALSKAAIGLPSLSSFTRSLQTPTEEGRQKMRRGDK
jgi:hypothetical protein